jgi:hypothetical protein
LTFPRPCLCRALRYANFKLHKTGVNKDVSSDESLSHSVTLVPVFVRTFGSGEQGNRVKRVCAWVTHVNRTCSVHLRVAVRCALKHWRLVRVQKARTRLLLLSDRLELCVIAGFLREVHENCALVGCYAECSGNSSPICCPETSVRSYNCMLLNSPEELRSHFGQKHKSDPNIGGLEAVELWDVQTVHFLHHCLLRVGVD